MQNLDYEACNFSISCRLHLPVLSRYVARRLHHGVPYFQNVTRFYGTGRSGDIVYAINTLWTGDADLRLYITTVQDG